MKQLERPDKDERVCYNCKYMLWLVGIGQGVRCGYNYKTSGLPQSAESIPHIPNLKHTCDKFEFETDDKKI